MTISDYMEAMLHMLSRRDLCDGTSREFLIACAYYSDANDFNLPRHSAAMRRIGDAGRRHRAVITGR